PCEGGVVIAGRFDALSRDAFATLTTAHEGQPIVFALGREVLAAPRVTAPITDGLFHLRATGMADDTALQARIERMRSAPLLTAHIRFSEQRTANAEADIACLTADPPLAGCACVEGYCERPETPALAACLGR